MDTFVLGLHVLDAPTAAPFVAPGDCFFQNPAPDWGVPGSAADDPRFVRDALTGYGPEVFGYVEPAAGTYRVYVDFANNLLSAAPASTATVRVYSYGVLKAEVSRALPSMGSGWSAVDVSWPSGDVAVLP